MRGNKLGKFGKVLKVSVLFGLLLGVTGCANAHSQSQSENKEEKVKEIKGDVVGAKEINGYTVQLLRQSGEKVTDSLSSYFGLYQGKYVLVSKKDNAVVSKLDLIYFENEVDDAALYYPETVTINAKDYNEDGLSDFALGQILSSYAIQYQFYTVLKDGTLVQMKAGGGSSVIADMEYSPLFTCEDKKISYEVYNQESGEYEEKEAEISLP